MVILCYFMLGEYFRKYVSLFMGLMFAFLTKFEIPIRDLEVERRWSQKPWFYLFFNLLENNFMIECTFAIKGSVN